MTTATVVAVVVTTAATETAKVHIRIYTQENMARKRKSSENRSVK
jgi:hypothetical protein